MAKHTSALSVYNAANAAVIQPNALVAMGRLRAVLSQSLQAPRSSRPAEAVSRDVHGDNVLWANG